MEEENIRAKKQAATGLTANSEAPQLKRVAREPERKQKAFYIQPSYAEAFEDLALAQKRKKGKKATELAEEMVSDLLAKYGVDISKL